MNTIRFFRTHLVLAIGWLTALVGVGFMGWGWGAWSYFKNLGQGMLGGFALNPELRRSPALFEAATLHPWLGSVGLLIAVVALALTVRFAEREAAAGRLA